MPYLSKIRLNGVVYDLKTAGQENPVTGVKGDSEDAYRTGNVNITKENIGLGDVGNFKAVSTEADQGLSNTEKTNARANIGLGTAATRSVPANGNANTTQVVLGNDSRLSDARPASDVPAWAKAESKPSYTKSEVGLGSVPNVTTDNQTPTFTEASTRANIASGETLSTLFGKIKKFFSDLKTVAFTGSYNDLTGRPTIFLQAKNFDADFKTKYRTETKGSATGGEYISTIRTDDAVESSSQYGSGIAWGQGDTHGYLDVGWGENSDTAYIGGGNGDKLNWVKRLCLAPFDLDVQSGQYGYKKTDGTFVAFRKPTGNAGAAQVLSGYTASNASSDGFSGSMPDNSTRTSNGNVPGVNNAYSSYPVRDAGAPQFSTGTDNVKRYIMSPPKGYYPGNTTSYIGELASNFGNANDSDVLNTKTFTSENGKNITGSIPVRSVTSQVAGDKTWGWSTNMYFGVNYGYYPADSRGGMSNVSEVYITKDALARDIGIDTSKMLNNYSVLDKTGSIPVKASNNNQALTGGHNGTGAYIYLPYGYYPSDGVVGGQGAFWTYVHQSYVKNMHIHSDVVTPNSYTAAFDMGENHNYRYINTKECYKLGAAACMQGIYRFAYWFTINDSKGGDDAIIISSRQCRFTNFKYGFLVITDRNTGKFLNLLLKYGTNWKFVDDDYGSTNKCGFDYVQVNGDSQLTITASGNSDVFVNAWRYDFD